MTNRMNPELTGETGETLPAWAVAAIAAAAEQSDKARQSAVVAAMLANPETFTPQIGQMILNAPTGPTPAETLTSHLANLVDRLAGFVLATRPHDVDADVPAMLAAALTRVTPDTASVEKVLAGATGRTRRHIPRDWSSAAGVYSTEKGNRVRVSVDAAGVPTFHVGRQTFTSATGATRVADGWGDAKGGWANPFVSWTLNEKGHPRHGETLATLAPESVPA